MTEQSSDTQLSDVLNQIIEGGLSALPEAFTLLLNEAMIAERSRHVQAQPHERTAERAGLANGFKPKPF